MNSLDDILPVQCANVFPKALVAGPTQCPLRGLRQDCRSTRCALALRSNNSAPPDFHRSYWFPPLHLFNVVFVRPFPACFLPKTFSQRKSGSCHKPILKDGCPQACMDRRNTFSGFWLLRMCLVFNHPPGSPTGKSFDEAMRNFELQRDREFSSHICG